MKKIEGYEDYSISEYGDIINSKGYVFKKQIVHGYEMVSLTKNKIKKRYFVHRLVAINYIGYLEGKPHINHKDGNKLNNHISNLEWCTPKENNIHMHKIGLWKSTEKHKTASKKNLENYRSLYL